MIKDYDQEHELVRKELWTRVACAYVESSNSINKTGAATWADQVLKDFDERFKDSK